MRVWPVALLVTASGFAGLSWEVLWQQRAALALGASAQATAIVLACTMAGMAAGAALMGRWLAGRIVARPLLVYCALELIIGLAGVALIPGFAALEVIDGAVWRANPLAVPFVHALCITVLLGPPTLAMGATIPVLVPIVRRMETSISRLYAFNIFGASLGVLAAAFVLLPVFGVFRTALFCVAINLCVSSVAFVMGARGRRDSDDSVGVRPSRPRSIELGPARVVVFCTGLVTFGLEVSWFRSLRAAFQSTTDSFAIILVAVLVPLALGAAIARKLPLRSMTMTVLLVISGTLILAATPIIERFDLTETFGLGSWAMLGARLGLSLVVLGPPMIVLGAILPWTLEQHLEVRAAGQLYGFNTLGAVAGALGAAWLALPHLGFAATAWICGAIPLVIALFLGRLRAARLLPIGVVALVAAVGFESGVGRLRVQGAYLRTTDHEVLDSREGPDATASAIELSNGARELVIDGFQTSGDGTMGHYMTWMGRLPMVLHREPRRALVICFGIGRTADAVRDEGPDALDIVELNPAVLELAPLFSVNQGVLQDRRTRTIVMDGRAWLRRTRERYDVVTLEPMSPHFAGTNALYSETFYRHVTERLSPDGVVAQWLPFHLVPPRDAASIARTFISIVPRSWLWIDPVDRTGILVGTMSQDEGDRIGELPGFDRMVSDRELTEEAVRQGFVLGPSQLVEYGRQGTVITDDNLLLAYGSGRRESRWLGHPAAVHRANLDVVEGVRAAHPRPW